MICANDIFCFCESADLIAVERLLNEGVNPDAENADGNTVLQIAATIGNVDLVNLLLKWGASIDVSNLYGWTPLMHAVQHGNLSVVKHLIKMKAKVNVYTKLGLSPAVIASWSGNLPILKLLVEAGAIVNHAPSMNQQAECNLSAIMAAAMHGHTNMINFLLNHKVEINSISPNTGLSPLMLAASGNHLDTVKAVLTAGADLDLMDVCNQSAFIHAQLNNAEDVIEYLQTLLPAQTTQGNADVLESMYLKEHKSMHLSSCSVRKETHRSSMNISPHERSLDSVFSSPLKKETLVQEGSFLRKSQADTKVKDWMGSLFTHLSPRSSRASQKSTEDVFSDDDVFVKQLEIPIVLPPHKLHEEELKKHTVEAVLSPLPKTAYTPLSTLSKPIIKRPHGNALRLPKLLKRRTKMKDFMNESFPKHLPSTSSTTIIKEHSHGTSLKSNDGSGKISATLKSIAKTESHTTKDSITCKEDSGTSQQSDLQCLLRETSLQKYVDLFTDHEIDMKTFQHLTENDLKEIGVQSFDSQQKLIDIIRKMRKI